MSTVQQIYERAGLREQHVRARPRRARGRRRARRRRPSDVKRAVLETAARELRAAAQAVLAANAEDVADAKARGAVRRHARPARARRASGSKRRPRGSKTVAALDDPVGQVVAEWTAAERARDRARARAARRDRHHLREPAERDGRRGGAVPEERQRGDPARRLRERALERCDPRVPRRARSRKHGLPATARADGADAGSRRRRHHAARHGGLHRRDRAARRQGSRRARAAGCARARDEPSRRHLPHLRPRGRRSRRWRAASP